jgi:hypothetical protein
MTRRTLTDELNSVLRAHSLDAPEPADTVDRILADTVGTRSEAANRSAVNRSAVSSAAASSSWRWRPSGPSLIATSIVAASIVAVLVLAVAGINTARHQSGRQTTNGAVPAASSGPKAADATASEAFGNGPALGSKAPAQADKSANVPPPAAPPSYFGSSLNCSKIPGGHLDTGAWAGVRLSASGQVRYVYEFRCVGTNGQRSASEVQIFQPAGGLLKYQQTLIWASGNEHIDAITVVGTDGGTSLLQVQSSVAYKVTGGVPDSVQVARYLVDGQSVSEGASTLVAAPCQRKDVTVTLSSRAGSDGEQSWLLALVNRASSPCALEGFPTLVTYANAKPVGAALAHRMSGPSGGVTKSPVPPIIVLQRGATAAAVIERAGTNTDVVCAPSSELAVTLPNGVSLGRIPASLSTCGLAVHPLVGNAAGSD